MKHQKRAAKSSCLACGPLHHHGNGMLAVLLLGKLLGRGSRFGRMAWKQPWWLLKPFRLVTCWVLIPGWCGCTKSCHLARLLLSRAEVSLLKDKEEMEVWPSFQFEILTVGMESRLMPSLYLIIYTNRSPCHPPSARKEFNNRTQRMWQVWNILMYVKISPSL